MPTIFKYEHKLYRNEIIKKDTSKNDFVIEYFILEKMSVRDTK